jgi:hypothetical protein
MSRLIFDAATLGGTTTLSSVDAVGNFTIDVPAATGPLLIPTSVGIAGQALVSSGTAVPIWQTAGTGTVTSVSFTGGLISVATPTSTPTLTVAGTSGGVPYFSSASTWATSAALAANALMIGGGAGAAPATTTTGTGVVTALGVNIGTTGSFVLNGGALGTPSSGTVTNLTGTASININGTVGATTPSTGVFTAVTDSGLTAGRVNYNGTGGLLVDSANLTFDGTTLTNTGNAIILDNSANAALRITQIGAGNALLVEDSANPDASPFVINTNGVVIQDKTTARTNYFAGTTTAQLQASTFVAVDRGGNFDAGPAFILSKNRGATGDSTVVVSQDTLGQISFQGADGTNLIPAASIQGQVDGTPGANDMPGRLIFLTTPDNTATPVERMRIASTGIISLGATAGLESLRATPVASAVNYLNVQGAVTTASPSITAAGSDTDIALNLTGKGTGGVTIVSSTATNYLTLNNGSANQLSINRDSGSGTFITFNSGILGFKNLNSSGAYSFLTNTNQEQVRISATASVVNYLNLTGAVTGAAPTFSTAGSDTNIDLALTPKGTGVLAFGTYTAGIIAQAGSITIKDAAGNTRRLLVG